MNFARLNLLSQLYLLEKKMKNHTRPNRNHRIERGRHEISFWCNNTDRYTTAALVDVLLFNLLSQLIRLRGDKNAILQK